MKPVGFDWDDDKSAANLAKHLVSFEEAMSGFDIRLPAADMSGRKTVKKNETAEGSDEMRPHYDFDDSKSHPNRLAGRPKLGRVRSVVLEPDVAEVFHSSDQVNELLRSIITNLPSRGAEKKPLKKRAS